MELEPRRFNYSSSNNEELDEDGMGFLEKMIQPHIDSFNHFVINKLSESMRLIRPVEFYDSSDKLKFYIQDASVSMPHVSDSLSTYMYPYECRIRGTTYNAPLSIKIGWEINGNTQDTITRIVGRIPVMVKSDRCPLKNCTGQRLIELHEEAEEQGGYFICGGLERIIRFVLVQRRNYPLAIERHSWKSKSVGMTEFGVSLRSVDHYNRAVTNILHYNNDSTFVLSIAYKRQQYYLPFLVTLKMVIDYSEFHIYTDLLVHDSDSSLFKESIKSMLSQLRDLNITTRDDALSHIGRAFRMRLRVPEWYSDSQAGEFLVDACLCVHLKSPLDKYNMLVSMAHKLMGLITKKYSAESTDTLNNQEVLLPGQLYHMVLLDKLEGYLSILKERFLKIRQKVKGPVSITQIINALSTCSDVGFQLEYFVKSGNITSRAGLGLPQTNGFSIIADKLNFMRYITHFRSVHRGVYFSHSYSTKVRRLLPETWGFLCPVHTPDGAPCGLLNHLSQSCEITCFTQDVNDYLAIISQSLNVVNIRSIDPSVHVCAYVDGQLIGYLTSKACDAVITEIKSLKVERVDRIEIIYIPLCNTYSMFPGLYIFSTPCRFVRPVRNLRHNCIEYVGTFEQLFLQVAIYPKDVKPETMYLEVDPVSILSITASLTPFCEHNQSPRNCYQCQMMKQSMGIPCLNIRFRFDHKLYWLNSVQSPICQSRCYQKIRLDTHPVGLNAVIAVISYTGYDMEDAIIINKSALDRGFASGAIYKCLTIELNDRNTRDKKLVFGCRKTDLCHMNGFVELDGLPKLGSWVVSGQTLYSFYDIYTDEYYTKSSKLSESAYVDGIVIADSDKEGVTKVKIRLRIPRNPLVGDKFASRHGQKGILSFAWPAEDMPFSESGIIPDIIFNPHGFPSRMTIGMMIETMASKVGALNGIYYDCSPFREYENSPVEYFGEKLAEAGFNYYGSERMYSGVNGQELEANIFMGVVYYQRLRHMVSDKFQVRTSGPVDPLTHQPVGGRARGGGVRFGEMERDCLISHGCPYLLNDRLLDCSDKSLTFVCSECGDLLSTKLVPARSFDSAVDFKPLTVVLNRNPQQYVCLLCKSSSHITSVCVPYVLRYLLVELASMNIRVKLIF